MEKKIKLRKGNITKEIPVNLVSEYMQLGWKKDVKSSKNKSFLETEKNTYGTSL